MSLQVVADAVTQLRRRLTELEQEITKTREAIAVLVRLQNGTPVPPKHPGRVYSYGVDLTCTRCRKPFKAAKRRSVDGPSFCHSPCTSQLYIMEMDKATRPVEHPKPTVLVPGDPLRGSRNA